VNRFDITSSQNPRIRDRAGLFVIEGAREIGLALRGGVSLEEVFVHPPLAAGVDEGEILHKIESCGIRTLSVSRKVFARIAYRETTGGLVAVAVKPRFSLAGLPRVDNPLYLVVDGVEKPGNIGAMLRSADGAGATGLIVTNPGTDLCNPNIIRASLGTLFTVPSAISDAGAALRWLRERQISLCVSSPHADTLHTLARLTGACAIVLGSEDTGIGEQWHDEADQLIRIPLRGTVDSLNVSAAAAVLLYEAARQRAG
jgi:TrmH family RNA methyltransferase